MSAISLRAFGKADARMSALGLGGHHLGERRLLVSERERLLARAELE